MTTTTPNPAALAAQPGRASGNSKRLVTAVEMRCGKTKDRPFRLVALTSQTPAQALKYVSTKIGVLMKEAKPLGKDRYLYAIPEMDGLPTQVRARSLPVRSDLAPVATAT